jgi:putrescine transport system ATP-binding protein
LCRTPPPLSLAPTKTFSQPPPLLQPTPADARPEAPPAAPLIRVEALSKRFGSLDAVSGVDLDLMPGEFFCLLGPSGCGKSTLLRLVAGFEVPSAGRILFEGADITAVPPHRRPLNMMFQSYALFPHMSVGRNVAYGLVQAGLPRPERSARVTEMLRLVRLEGFEDRRPDKLSGGQRQRVALARALARRPRALLLDEPMAALDRALREETQGELRAVQRRLGTTFVVVTHDPGEAMSMADRIGVMEAGRLVQVGPPAALYERPATRFTAGLLGDVNLIAGRLGAGEGGRAAVETAHGRLLARAPAHAAVGDEVVVAVRPERLRLAADDGDNRIAGTVTEITFLGDRLRLRVAAGDGPPLRVMLPAGMHAPTVGAAVALAFAPDAATVLPV